MVTKMDIQTPELRAAIELCLKNDLTVASQGPEWSDNDAQERDHTIQIQPGSPRIYTVFYDGKKVNSGNREEAINIFFEECNRRQVGNYYLEFSASGCPIHLFEDENPLKIKVSDPKIGMTCVLENGKIGVIAGIHIWGLKSNEVLIMTEEGIQRHYLDKVDLRPELIWEYARDGSLYIEDTKTD